jgi:hypothetical protein
VVRVPTADVNEVLQVQVGGLLTSHTINGKDVLVTIPAFATSGPITLHFEHGPAETHNVPLIGLLPPAPDVNHGSCRGADGLLLPGCLELKIAPEVGPEWLAAIARLLDADVVAHDVRYGQVLVRLRALDREAWALHMLQETNGVLSAKGR